MDALGPWGLVASGAVLTAALSAAGVPVHAPLMPFVHLIKLWLRASDGLHWLLGAILSGASTRAHSWVLAPIGKLVQEAAALLGWAASSLVYALCALAALIGPAILLVWGVSRVYLWELRRLVSRGARGCDAALIELAERLADSHNYSLVRPYLWEVPGEDAHGSLKPLRLAAAVCVMRRLEHAKKGLLDISPLAELIDEGLPARWWLSDDVDAVLGERPRAERRALEAWLERTRHEAVAWAFRSGYAAECARDAGLALGANVSLNRIVQSFAFRSGYAAECARDAGLALGANVSLNRIVQSFEIRMDAGPVQMLRARVLPKLAHEQTMGWALLLAAARGGSPRAALAFVRGMIREEEDIFDGHHALCRELVGRALAHPTDGTWSERDRADAHACEGALIYRSVGRGLGADGAYPISPSGAACAFMRALEHDHAHALWWCGCVILCGELGVAVHQPLGVALIARAADVHGCCGAHFSLSHCLARGLGGLRGGRLAAWVSHLRGLRLCGRREDGYGRSILWRNTQSRQHAAAPASSQPRKRGWLESHEYAYMLECDPCAHALPLAPTVELPCVPPARNPPAPLEALLPLVERLFAQAGLIPRPLCRWTLVEALSSDDSS